VGTDLERLHASDSKSINVFVSTMLCAANKRDAHRRGDTDVRLHNMYFFYILKKITQINRFGIISSCNQEKKKQNNKWSNFL